MSSQPTIVTPDEPDFYSGTQWERREHGGILIDGQQVASTLQCPHCGGHFISRRGSGHRRTFCMNCKAVTCGHPACDPCIPWEKKMEFIEREASREARGL